jgi:hypothetical protein
MVIFLVMGEVPNPHIEDDREKTTRADKKKRDWRPAMADRSAAVSSKIVIVDLLVEEQAHFLPVALHGAFRDSAQLRDFGE